MPFSFVLLLVLSAYSPAEEQSRRLHHQVQRRADKIRRHLAAIDDWVHRPSEDEGDKPPVITGFERTADGRKIRSVVLEVSRIRPPQLFLPRSTWKLTRTGSF